MGNINISPSTEKHLDEYEDIDTLMYDIGPPTNIKQLTRNTSIFIWDEIKVFVNRHTRKIVDVYPV